ncbi:MAG: hypothetical protein R6V01_02795 [Thermoplasmatota archaeon]
MGILDDIEKIDEKEGLRSTIKRIEKLEEENNKLLKEILKRLKDGSLKKNKKKTSKRRD